MKWDIEDRPNQANIDLARHLARWSSILIVGQHTCVNCKKPATVMVAGFHRCQPCANHLVTLWNEMRSELDKGRS